MSWVCFFLLFSSLNHARQMLAHKHTHTHVWSWFCDKQKHKQASCLRVTLKAWIEWIRRRSGRNEKEQQHAFIATHKCCVNRAWFIFSSMKFFILSKFTIFFHATQNKIANYFQLKKLKRRKISFNAYSNIEIDLKSVFNVQSTHIPCDIHIVVFRLTVILTVGWRSVCWQ